MLSFMLKITANKAWIEEKWQMSKPVLCIEDLLDEAYAMLIPLHVSSFDASCYTAVKAYVINSSYSKMQENISHAQFEEDKRSLKKENLRSSLGSKLSSMTALQQNIQRQALQFTCASLSTA